MNSSTEYFDKLKAIISREKTLCKELTALGDYMKKADVGEQRIIDSQVVLTQKTLRNTNQEISEIIEKINPMKIPGSGSSVGVQSVVNPQNQEKTKEEFKENAQRIQERAVLETNLRDLDESSQKTEKPYSLKELRPVGLEKLTIKRMKKKEKKVEVKKEKGANQYVTLANRLFSKLTDKIMGERTFEDMERDLIKANLQFTSRSYISVIFLSTCIALVAGIIIGLFFLFFKITPLLPIIVRASGEFISRLWKSALIMILSPILTFIIMYTYPGLEKGSTETRIDEELPFATIHMSAISGSMIDPTKIFEIIISTHEYPYIEKEFKKLMNEINLYGLDLVSALRNSSFNSPSKKLSELFNGLATTINSGGYLPDFFDKRAQTLMFDNRLAQEKKTKAAETFMDIYISLVIAAPMILMILLMMMKISGMGLSMTTSMITIIMVSAVTVINIVFLTFLHLKR
jgi:hypothetical protein